MAPCPLCLDFKKKDEDDPRLSSESTAQQILDVRSRRTCDVCLVVIQGILFFEDDTWSLKEDVSRVYLYALSDKGDTLTVEVYFHAERPKLVLEYFSTKEPKKGWEAIRKRNSINGQTVIPDGVRWTKSMLRTCSTEHSSCVEIETSEFPKRTVFFQQANNRDIDVKLQEHKGNQGTYAALSHCWGSIPTCTTTSQNLRGYTQAIPWTALSSTFRDSIMFCLELGIHHIWIDALCIVQDDARDWEVESSKMADVYQNAYITLAATTSSDGNGGCYSTNQEAVREFDICPDVLVREKVSHWQEPLTRSSTQAYPLLSRGWVLQERYLSRRLLHFCHQELAWECTEQLTCQCGGILAACDPLEKVLLVRSINDLSNVTNKLPTKFRRWKGAKNRVANTLHSSIFSSIKKERKLMAASFNTSDRGTLSQDKYFDQWHAIIEQYSALGLSRATDRLPALSGLAVRASSIFGQYMCGLWYKNMLRDLMWRVALLHHDSVRPDCYTGPSWSWASVNGAVKYWHDINDQCDQEEEAIRRIDQSLNAETWYERGEAHRLLSQKTRGESLVQWQVSQLRLSCEVESMGGNPFGEIITGRLHITGFMQRASLQYAYHRTASQQAEPLPYDPLRYLVSVQGVELTLPFFADYVLSEGPHKLPDGATINLLLIHPNIALVLLKHGRVFYTYERIGIVRQPSSYLTLYNLNWMSENVMMTIIIT